MLKNLCFFQNHSDVLSTINLCASCASCGPCYHAMNVVSFTPLPVFISIVSTSMPIVIPIIPISFRPVAVLLYPTSLFCWYLLLQHALMISPPSTAIVTPAPSSLNPPIHQHYHRCQLHHPHHHIFTGTIITTQVAILVVCTSVSSSSFQSFHHRDCPHQLHSFADGDMTRACV